MRVRLRIDGVLREHLRLPHWMCAALVSRVKVLAKLDIATQRIPQDGRIKARRGERRLDLRVSTLPTQFGEKAVLRLLGSASTPSLAALGLSADEMSLLDDGLNQPQGLILVTGPTGAGKSTTLYSMLTSRQSTDVNIVTIEDPIEYQVPGASQVQVDAQGRPHLRQLPPRDPAAGSGRHPGRRGPRSRDRRGRVSGGAHRPSGLQHAAHERLGGRDRAAARSRREAAAHHDRDQPDRGAAPRAAHLHDVPRALRPLGPRAPQAAHPGRRPRVPARQGLPGVRAHRVLGPRRDLRDSQAHAPAQRARHPARERVGDDGRRRWRAGPGCCWKMPSRRCARG